MLEGISELKKYFKEWLEENKEELGEEGLEGFVLPTLLNNIPYLKDIPYMLGIFPFECEDIIFSGRYSHTTYKTPSGINYDAYCKNEGMEIKINKGSFGGFFTKLTQMIQSNRTTYGGNLGAIDTLIFKFLGWQQTKFPIFFKSSKFVGPVVLNDWNINERAVSSYFSASLKQTSLRALKKYNYKGSEGEVIKVKYSNNSPNVGTSKK